MQSLQVADWREALTSGPWMVYGPKATKKLLLHQIQLEQVPLQDEGEEVEMMV